MLSENLEHFCIHLLNIQMGEPRFVGDKSPTLTTTETTTTTTKDPQHNTILVLFPRPVIERLCL